MLPSTQAEPEQEDYEDILQDSLSFIGGTTILDDPTIHYGPLALTVAPKEGKANTLLADHLFSPALFLAERIERQLLSASNLTVVELGSGTGLPSLLLSTQNNAPSLVVVTDYPDETILVNLRKNVDRNQGHVNEHCTVKCVGYAWGTDTQHLTDLLPSNENGFDVVIMSDLLHFDSFHDILVDSITKLLKRSPTARVQVAAGNYTPPNVCDSFLAKAANASLEFQEIITKQAEQKWLGEMEVGGFDTDALSFRKMACRYWIGKWKDQTPIASGTPRIIASNFSNQ